MSILLLQCLSNSFTQLAVLLLLTQIQWHTARVSSFCCPFPFSVLSPFSNMLDLTGLSTEFCAKIHITYNDNPQPSTHATKSFYVTYFRWKPRKLIKTNSHGNLLQISYTQNRSTTVRDSYCRVLYVWHVNRALKRAAGGGRRLYPAYQSVERYKRIQVFREGRLYSVYCVRV